MITFSIRRLPLNFDLPLPCRSPGHMISSIHPYKRTVRRGSGISHLGEPVLPVISQGGNAPRRVLHVLPSYHGNVLGNGHCQVRGVLILTRLRVLTILLPRVVHGVSSRRDDASPVNDASCA
ncbi:hypothetical protein PGTUg99_003654 [Puccinia graminis f. sp. tritici]|uniref:Uncharacterized protein n=1 Tax=Puccinia graminis f. sp. tritici TaxID=56615 RepID=A0A5B0RQK8_PUCGR|nr:hypothetical protein PGTUg99_000611 [Puccinia graminis f. sp. tritici]KAA1127622.1 hypothetical protein PGTUg99_003654 [Puccinia graminis f. sp. tritici]